MFRITGSIRLKLPEIANRTGRLFLALLMFLSATAYPKEPLVLTADIEGLPLFTPTIIFPGRFVTNQAGEIISVTIPLKHAGRLLLLEAIIDGRIGTFILDTGATGLVLNQTYFRDYMPMDDVAAGGITGSTGKTYRVRVKKLQLSDMVFERLYADVTNLGHIENRRGVQVFGLFGMSMMKEMEMVIDVKNNELQLHRLDNKGDRLAEPAEKIVYDIRGRVDEHHNMMYVEVIIGEKTLEFCLDTGAESNVIDMSLPKKVLNTVTILRRTTLRGAGSGSREVLFGNMNDFSVGGEKLEDMQVMITNLSGLSQKYGYAIDGMLGYDFFQKGRIYINLVKHELGVVLSKEVKP